MPLVNSSYKTQHVFKNGHFSTVYAALFKKVKGIRQTRERLTLNDGDFLDLDWSYASTHTNKVLIALHGLEGSANRPYILGTAKIFNANNVDVVAVNFRGCSGEPNLHYRSYHSGATEDLKDVIDHVLTKSKYSDIYAIGFSLGGNVLLKYLGEKGENVPQQLKAAVAVSVPVHLSSSCVELHKTKNWLYANRFLSYLSKRLKQKQKQFPDHIKVETLKKIRSLKDFDDVYTSKAHGFKDAEDYYQQCSSLHYLKDIAIPTLLLNAKNDSFLSEQCFPYIIAKSHQFLYLETPEHGGHVGFYHNSGVYYYESRALDFLIKG